jgi:hypothetical protein
MPAPDLYKIPHETSSFRLPEHGSPELVNYISNLTLGNGDNLQATSASNIPIADINKVLPYMEADDTSPRDKCVKVAQILAFNRLANRICEECGDKSELTALSICSDCALSWYCSKECQGKHWDTHKLRCCKRTGPLDTGYQCIAILNTQQEPAVTQE